MTTTTRITIISTLLVGLSSAPALAHPGHGAWGWLHHGELFVLATAAAAAWIAARLARRPRA